MGTDRLRPRRQWDRALLEAIPDMLFVCNSSGDITDFKPSPDDIPLMAPEHFLNRRVQDVLPEEAATTIMQAVTRCLNGEGQQRFDYQLPMHGQLFEYEACMASCSDDEVVCTVRNVTEQRQAQRQLRMAHNELELRIMHRTKALTASEQRWRTLVSMAPDYVIQIDLNGRVMYFNRPLSGNGIVMQVGTHLFEVLDPTCHEAARQCCHLVEHTLRFDSFVASMQVDDSTKYMNLAIGPYMQNYVLEGMIIIASDITWRFDMERQLRTSQARLQALIENLPFDFWAMDTDHRYILQSKACREKWGSVVGKRLDELTFIPADTREEWSRQHTLALAGEVIQGHYHLEHLNENNTYWGVLAPIRSGNEITGILGASIDVTNQSRAERQIRESEQRFRMVFEDAGDAIFWADPESGLLINCNKAAEMLVERSRDDIIGTHFTSLHPPDKWEYCVEQFRQGHQSYGGDLGDNIEIITTSGKRKPVHIRTSVSTVWGKTIVQGIFRDISERKRAEERLRTANEQTQQANQKLRIALEQVREAAEQARQANLAKSRFVANVSHDIRTPMTAIMGMIDLLADSQLDDEQQEAIDTIRNAASLLLAIVNDILDISRLEAGKVELNIETLDIASVVRDLLALQAPTADAKGIALEYTIDQELARCPLRGDPVRLGQILLNLVSNAIKFTDEGSVHIHVRDDGHENDRRLVRIDVRDTGIGIENCQIPSLFKSFTQVHMAAPHHREGTGLGLAISASLIKLMGGRIWCDSTPGQGSTFTCVVPLETAAGVSSDIASDRTAQSAVPHKAPAAMNILLAEDNFASQKVLTRILSRAGCHVDVVDNGHDAVQAATSKSYDAVLMDVQMPGIDGLEATRLIRQWEQQHKTQRLYIIAMTAYAGQEDQRMCLDAGMDTHIGKPVDRELLLQTIHQAGQRQ